MTMTRDEQILIAGFVGAIVGIAVYITLTYLGVVSPVVFYPGVSG